ncbi:Hypothetical predicted protein [Mytilus galloprovincialis]|uniref:Asl1-like glycosyl hydrolase catalytic domain-containing protein n=1 Tax=Mytilus galloprovincialis TaxID=29158 RepID=A0A8B6E0U5_MYTGA|nr:Hypothetical predicted protein [Mytilus galloprovincialis]
MKRLMLTILLLLLIFDISNASSKKGLALSGGSAYMCGDEFALTNVHWWYDWHMSPWEHHKLNCSNTIKSGYVPMVWGIRPHVDTPVYILDQAHYVLGFNEPNFPQQSNISPQDAATHWKTIENKAHGKVLVAPAVAPCTHCNMNPFEWLDQFFQHCNGCKVDHISTHAYWCHADQIMNYLKQLWDRYHKPIWLTEFACQYSTSTTTQLHFMKEILPKLEAATYVFRYSWFNSRRTGNAHTTKAVSLLHQHSPTLTTLGQYYNNFM